MVEPIIIGDNTSLHALVTQALSSGQLAVIHETGQPVEVELLPLALPDAVVLQVTDATRQKLRRSGKRGGSARTPAKCEAARANGKKRKRKQPNP